MADEPQQISGINWRETFPFTHLRILVDTDGRPLEVRIEQSSGHAILDREALRHVQRHWTFRPALRDGQPVQAVGIVPIDFHLDRG